PLRRSAYCFRTAISLSIDRRSSSCPAASVCSSLPLLSVILLEQLPQLILAGLAQHLIRNVLHCFIKTADRFKGAMRACRLGAQPIRSDSDVSFRNSRSDFRYGPLGRSKQLVPLLFRSDRSAAVEAPVSFDGDRKNIGIPLIQNAVHLGNDIPIRKQQSLHFESFQHLLFSLLRAHAVAALQKRVMDMKVQRAGGHCPFPKPRFAGRK